MAESRRVARVEDPRRQKSTERAREEASIAKHGHGCVTRANHRSWECTADNATARRRSINSLIDQLGGRGLVNHAVVFVTTAARDARAAMYSAALSERLLE